jgi:hypothetical protein
MLLNRNRSVGLLESQRPARGRGTYLSCPLCISLLQTGGEKLAWPKETYTLNSQHSACQGSYPSPGDAVARNLLRTLGIRSANRVLGPKQALQELFSTVNSMYLVFGCPRINVGWLHLAAL